jgi:hypothetical protein
MTSTVMASGLRAAMIFSGSALLCACGAAPKAEAEVAQPTRSSEETGADRPKNAPRVSQELGEIDPQEVDRVFAKIQSQFQACQKSGMTRIGPLAGDVKFFVRIGPLGRAKYVVLEDSTLGDFETERCMLSAAENASWPVPRGGNEAEARKGFSFDAGDERPPASWGVDKLDEAIAKHQNDLKKCTQGVRGSFKVTLYVGPEKKLGKAMGVGVSAPNREGQEKNECIVDVVKSMKLPSPGGYLAKATFNL